MKCFKRHFLLHRKMCVSIPKRSYSMLMRQIFAVYSKNHTERVRASCGIVVEIFVCFLKNSVYAQVKILCELQLPVTKCCCSNN